MKGDLFSRLKNDLGFVQEVTIGKNLVICDTSELKEKIRKWMENEGWRYEDFATFCELVGLKTPVRLSDWNQKEYSFNCVTALSEEREVSIFFGDGMEFCSEISVKSGNEQEKYIINCNCKKGKTVPKVTLQGRCINENGNYLNSFYCDFFCHRVLRLADGYHTLRVDIDEPNASLGKKDIAVYRHRKEIEGYLVSLNATSAADVLTIYNTVINFLGFLDEDIAICDSIKIAYEEKVDEKNSIVRSIINISEGSLVEYAILENGETFHIFKNGNWKYISDNIGIDYTAESQRYCFSIAGSAEDISNQNPQKTLDRVEQKISAMWVHVK